MISEMEIGMVTELYLIGTNSSSDWQFDSCAIVHACNNKAVFQDYKDVTDHEVMMGNNNTTKVISKGSVELQFTSGKKLLLVNILYVPEIRTNLVSANLQCKRGFEIVLESNKIIVLRMAPSLERATHVTECSN